MRTQLQTLNNVQFSNGEWLRFVETFLDKPSEGIVDKTRKIHDDYIHDFVFDDGRIQNIYLLDKKNLARNKLQHLWRSLKGWVGSFEDLKHNSLLKTPRQLERGRFGV